MDEKKKLKILKKTKEALLVESEKIQAEPKISHPNQTNPLYKRMAKFNNSKIGDKWSIRDLLGK